MLLSWPHYFHSAPGFLLEKSRGVGEEWVWKKKGKRWKIRKVGGKNSCGRKEEKKRRKGS